MVKKNKQGDKGIFTKKVKEDFISAYIDNNFNTTRACDVIGISRTTYYAALKKDENFKNMVALSNVVYKNILRSAILEGITHSDLVLRNAYLKLIPNTVFAKLFGFEDVADNTFNLNFKKEDLIGE